MAEVVPIRRAAAGRAGETAGRPVDPDRVAAIDIGSNSIHMIVVEGDGFGGYRVLAREREMVRLGKSALARGSLSAAARRDGLEALLRMTTLARLKGVRQIVAAATSAVREADNGAEFVEQIRATTGLDVRVLDGREEGALVFSAVRHAVDLGPGWSVLADVGGGSTEWCVARGGELRSVRSVPLGSLRAARRLAGDPPSRRSLAALGRELRAELAKLRVPARLERLLATSGTAACCGDLADLFAGREPRSAPGALRELAVGELDDVIDRLAALRRREIAELPPVGPRRAGSILAGAVLLRELARHAGVEHLYLCDRALREGLALAALGEPAREPRASGEARRRQVDALAQRAPAMLDHARQVARLAARLFDLTSAVHNLGEREREWLEYAALLHDVGHSIHYQRHHKHSAYLIATADLDAFDPREIEILAQVARYHRGGRPKKRHVAFAALAAWQRRAVVALAALLRIANSLDRTHAARVAQVHASVVDRRKLMVEVLSPLDVSLELAAARDGARLFERAFDRKVRFRQGLGRAPSRGNRRS